jgi:flavin reductase (DIM6/NTAB) family NADH-FMN oxidoreductase RutF
LTVSSFAAVSLNPPTILVSINSASRAHALIQALPYFAVNILSAGQRAVSEYFARNRTQGISEEEISALTNPPPKVETRPTVKMLAISGSGATVGRGRVVPCPVLEESSAILECVVQGAFATGDHTTYFGLIEHVVVSMRDPLLYYDGTYQESILARRKTPRRPR